VSTGVAHAGRQADPAPRTAEHQPVPCPTTASAAAERSPSRAMNPIPDKDPPMPDSAVRRTVTVESSLVLWPTSADPDPRASIHLTVPGYTTDDTLTWEIADKVLGDLALRPTISVDQVTPYRGTIGHDEQELGAWSEGEQSPPVADPATGEVRVLSRRCTDCIYRKVGGLNLPGNRIPTLIQNAKNRDTFIPCHATLPFVLVANGLPPSPAAICHGYAQDNPGVFILRLARLIGRIVYLDPPPDRPLYSPETATNDREESR
jgi:hypothetical protein